MSRQQDKSKSSYTDYLYFILLCAAEATSVSRAHASTTNTKLGSLSYLEEQDINHNSRNMETYQNAIELAWLSFKELEHICLVPFTRGEHESVPRGPATKHLTGEQGGHRERHATYCLRSHCMGKFSKRNFVEV